MRVKLASNISRPALRVSPPKGKLEQAKELWHEAPMWYKSAALGLPTYVASAAGPGTLLHEFGHKWAADALFENAQPHVEFTPFKGGVTRYQPSPLSHLGESLGEDKSRGLRSAAGPAMDLFSSMAIFAAGHKMRHKHPNAAAAMMGYASYRAASATLYALSPAKWGHDFAGMQKNLGIPIWASAAVFAAALPLEYLVLSALENRHAEK